MQSLTHGIKKLILAGLTFSRFLLTAAVLLGAIFIAYQWNREFQPTRGELFGFHDELAKLASSPSNTSMMKLIVTGATGAGMFSIVQSSCIPSWNLLITILP